MHRTAEALVGDGESGERRNYPIVDGQPVLVDFDDTVLDEAVALASRGASAIPRQTRSGGAALVKRLLSPEKSRTKANVARLVSELKRRTDRPAVLVVGGGTVGQGMAALYDDPDIDVVSFDIYASPLTHFVADGHRIPVADTTFDAVVVQAVLEHVLRPEVVVAEVWRVLKDGGLAYAETPFMQQVHEGPYDFTRFTESGHRYLFRRFARIDSGVVAGPGTSFVWSTEHLVRSLLRSHRAGKIAKLLVFWVQYLDRFAPDSYAADSASGVYFLGSRSHAVVTAHEIIAQYRGAQVSHP